MLTADQRYIRTRMLMGLVAAVLTMVAGWLIAPAFTLSPMYELPVRFWAIIWSLAIASLPLFVLVAMIAYRRFFGSAIGGDHSDPRVEINARVLNNSHEQFTLLMVALILLASGLPEDHLAMLPYLAVAFILFRVLFWLGYQKGPLMRSFGFAAGFYLNVIGAIFSILLLFGAL